MLGRISIVWGRVLVVAACLILSPTTAQAVVGSYLGQQGFNDEVQNAADAAESALAAAATNGNTVRGASGSLGQLLLNSGSLICNSWIIQFQLNIRNMHIAAATMDGDALTRQLNAIQKSEAFAAKLGQACEQSFGTTPPVGGGGSTGTGGGGVGGGGTGGGTTGPGAGGGTTGPSTSGRLPGESTADFICRDRCRPAYGAMQDALKALDRANQASASAHAAAAQAAADLQSAQSQLADQETKLSQLRASPPPPLTGGRNAALEAQWTSYNNAVNSARASIRDLRGRIDRLKQEAKDLDKDAKDWDKRVQRAQADAQAAVDAYNDCVNRCRSAAAMGGEHVTIPQAPPPPPARHDSILDHFSIGIGIGGGRRDDDRRRDRNTDDSRKRDDSRSTSHTQNPGDTTSPDTGRQTDQR